jgi:hypothetical protein
VELLFAFEPSRRRWNRHDGRGGNGKGDYSCLGSIGVVQSEDAGGTVTFELAAVVRMHEGADEERGEERAKNDERQGSLAKRSAMRSKTHHRRA